MKIWLIDEKLKLYNEWKYKDEKWDDHSSIVQLFENLKLSTSLYVFPMEASKAILGRCGTPIYFA
jgi:hypothetical protein